MFFFFFRSNFIRINVSTTQHDIDLIVSLKFFHLFRKINYNFATDFVFILFSLLILRMGGGGGGMEEKQRLKSYVTTFFADYSLNVFRLPKLSAFFFLFFMFSTRFNRQLEFQISRILAPLVLINCRRCLQAISQNRYLEAHKDVRR